MGPNTLRRDIVAGQRGRGNVEVDRLPRRERPTSNKQHHTGAGAGSPFRAGGTQHAYVVAVGMDDDGGVCRAVPSKVPKVFGWRLAGLARVAALASLKLRSLPLNAERLLKSWMNISNWVGKLYHIIVLF